MNKFSRRQFIPLAVGGAVCLSMRSIAAVSPIDDSGFVRIGGIDQWLAIQGQDVRNPVILYLHGGPGEAQSPFLQQFLPWQRDFTVANWDQRGAGKTYGRNGSSTPDVTLGRLIDDACEIAEHLRGRLAQKKVILVGQSAGSFLGVHVIKKRPDLFHAFVGTGQMVSYLASVATQVQWARQQAQAAGDQATLKALDDAGILTAQPSRVMAEANAARKWLMTPSDGPYTQMIQDFMGPKPDAAKGDAADWVAGATFSGQKLARFILPKDLRTLGLDMPIPFFVVQGREDHIAGFEPAKAYVEEIRAPAKAFIPIDGGHYACFTDADQFIAALKQHVRPLVI